MGLLSIFKSREKQKEFSEMNKTEARFFLANDLIERMIRIEQKLRCSMGEKEVEYFHTEYYKGLTEKQKDKFKEYTRKKERRKKWKFFSVGLIGLLGIVFLSKMTGNVISMGLSAVSISNLLLVFAVIALLIIFYISTFFGKEREKRLHRHFAIMERIIEKKNKRRIS